MARVPWAVGEPMLMGNLPLAACGHPSVDWNSDVKPVFI